MKYVIIGNSAAGTACARAIRENDAAGEITIVSSEKYHTYSRPLISYLLMGKTDAERMKYRPDDFYDKNGITLLSGKTAQSIDVKAKTVNLGGETLKYGKLLAAAGSRPFVPPIKGLESIKYHTFMSMDDALSLEKAVTKASRVFILGAGLIGLKCAEALAGRAKSVTVCDIADRILPGVLDEKGAGLVQAHLEKSGVKFILGQSAAAFEGNKALLSGGSAEEFDVLVAASGVRPNVSLVKDAGGEVDKGILINERCETTLPNVYAAGDCAQGYDISTGKRRVLALLPNAVMQGICAGENMSGKASGFKKGVAMNATGLLGLHIITAGIYSGESTLIEKDESYKRLFVKDGLLKGYIMIGDVARAGIYTSLIREQTPLESIDFELICEKPQLMAFTRSEIQRKLGTRV